MCSSGLSMNFKALWRCRHRLLRRRPSFLTEAERLLEETAREDDVRASVAADAAGHDPLEISVTTMAGDVIALPPLPVSIRLIDLKRVIKEELHIPPCVQKLMLADKLLTDDDSATLFNVFDLGSSKGAQVELHVVRGALLELDSAQEVLLQATARGDHAAMEEMLDYGASANGRPELCEITPMLLAVAADDAVATSMLREAGAEEPCMETRHACMGTAFRKLDLAGVVRFLAKGESPNRRLRRGQGITDTNHGTPLHACCVQNRLPGATALVELLLRLGAEMNAADHEGDTVLASARFYRAKDIYMVLRRRGATMAGPFYNYPGASLLRLVGAVPSLDDPF
eukprot:TRINITY_DN24606_c0_g2_i1.p1 TRINITY_DN24606_c0_g2~~TRINITY_DN24606_c0_g2_i1.p1  ORF type:complete len:342 (+),score=66.94 TRINITY_DN24606_c0_g2_i1:56-1081(+)